MTPRRIAVAAAFAFLAAVFLFSTWRDFARGPHVDEVEHLHTAARIARGDRIYVDFAQHHSPLFYGLLMPLVHRGNSVAAMQGDVTRARLLVAAITAIAIAAASLVLWRASANPWTVVTFVGIVFAAGGVWRNGLGDVRPDTPAVALWWTGAALALLSRRAALRGFGAGLVFVGALVTPKWPLMSLVVGIALLIEIGRDRRALLTAAAVAILTAAAGVGAIALLSDLRLTAFHVIELTSAMVKAIHAQGPKALDATPPFFGCPPLLRPWTIALAAALIALAWFRNREAFASRRRVAVLLALAAASLCEIRFFFPYPAVDFRYYANWVFAASAVLALAPQSAAAVLAAMKPSLEKLGTAISAVATALALFAALDLVAPPRPQPDHYWRMTAWLMARLRPGDTVWIGAWRHPIGVPDASYHWYGVEVMPATLRVAATEEGRRFLPPIGEGDLPPCRVERGLDRNVRFLIEPMPTIPVARACFERLVRRGAIVRTPVGELWMVPRS